MSVLPTLLGYFEASTWESSELQCAVAGALAMSFVRFAVLNIVHALCAAQIAEDSAIKINHRPHDHGQEDRERTTWPSVLFTAVELFGLMAIGLCGRIGETPIFDSNGLGIALMTHALIVEPIYYIAHRAMHDPRVYKYLHKHHHLSVVPTPKTAVTFLWPEHLLYDILFAIPLVIPSLMGRGSWILLIFWVPITIDLINTAGHLNFEIFPSWWMDSPFYPFFYTTTYHHVHHQYFNYNYALFMPIWDMVFGTYDAVRTRRDWNAAIAGRELAADKRKRQIEHQQGKKAAEEHVGRDQQVMPHLFSSSDLNAETTTTKPTRREHRTSTQCWRLTTEVEYIFFVHAIEPKDFLRFTSWSRKHMKHSGPDIQLSLFEKYIAVPVISCVFPLLVILSPWLGSWLVNWTYAFIDGRTLGGVVRPMPVLPIHYLAEWTSELTLEALKSSMTQAKLAYPNLKVCGLGALNKNVVFSESGAKLVEHANKLGIKLATGNTMTAAVACGYMQRAAESIRGDRRVFVTGATSSCGQGIVSYLALNGFDVTFYTRSVSRGSMLLGSVQAQLAAKKDKGKGSVSWSSEISDASDFNFVLIGSSSDAIIPYLGKDAALDYCGCFAVPPPKGLSQAVTKYQDVGKLGFCSDREAAEKQGKPAFSMEGTFRCPRDTTYACHVGTKVHEEYGHSRHEVGPVDAADMDIVFHQARQLGFDLVQS